jgi:hypothetical protein
LTIRMLLTVVLIVLCARPGFAADSIRQKDDMASLMDYLNKMKKDSEARESQTFEGTIERCVRQVRVEVPDSQFDAYASDSRAKSFGTPEEYLKFNQCMAQNGRPLVPKK